MRVDVHEPHRAVAADRAQDRMADRMVAPGRQRFHSRRHHFGDERLDVLVALLQAEARAERHVADVGRLQFRHRRDAVGVVERPDPLDVADRPRPEARARAVGDGEVHRHADQRHIDPGELLVRRLRPVRRADQGRDIGIRQLAPSRALEAERRRLTERVPLGLVRFFIRELLPPRGEFVGVDHFFASPDATAGLPSRCGRSRRAARRRPVPTALHPAVPSHPHRRA